MPTPTIELQEVDIPSGMDYSSLQEAVIQAEGDSADGQPKRRVKVTLIAVGPGNNVDKCYYTQECINSGPAYFEGARAFANHISAFEKQVQPERKILEEIGFYTDVVVEGEKLTGILNILDGNSLDQYWDRIKGAIAYAKRYPGRNIFGLSIHAAGDYKPMTYQGQAWKSVFRFADVKSCDFVTWPARNGEFTAVLSESEKNAMKDASKTSGPQAGDIFKTLKDHVTALSSAGAPGADETRRIVDQLGTSLKLNKQEDQMDPVTQQPATDPSAGVTDESLKSEAMAAGHKQMAESYRKQAETETEAGKKGHALGMAERHAKMAEALVHAAPGANVHVSAPAAPAAPAAPPDEAAQAEARRQAEAKAQAEAKGAPPALPATESEFQGKYVNLLVDNLLDKSGLSVGKKDYLRTVVLEGEKDENRIRGKVASFIRAELMETNRGGHGAPRIETPNLGGGKTEIKNRPGMKKILANAKG